MLTPNLISVGPIQIVLVGSGITRLSWFAVYVLFISGRNAGSDYGMTKCWNTTKQVQTENHWRILSTWLDVRVLVTAGTITTSITKVINKDILSVCKYQEDCTFYLRTHTMKDCRGREASVMFVISLWMRTFPLTAVSNVQFCLYLRGHSKMTSPGGGGGGQPNWWQMVTNGDIGERRFRLVVTSHQ